VRIGELAHATGVSASLLRYYEAQGLLSPSRTDNGYRHYDEYAATTVRQVRGLLQAGLPTKEIRLLLPCATSSTPELEPCSEVLKLLRAHVRSRRQDRLPAPQPRRAPEVPVGGRVGRNRSAIAWRRHRGLLLDRGQRATGGAVPGTCRREADQHGRVVAVENGQRRRPRQRSHAEASVPQGDPPTGTGEPWASPLPVGCPSEIPVVAVAWREHAAGSHLHPERRLRVDDVAHLRWHRLRPCRPLR
jgi:DNA-binding transcriptional MerR regulator